MSTANWIARISIVGWMASSIACLSVVEDKPDEVIDAGSPVTSDDAGSEPSDDAGTPPASDAGSDAGVATDSGIAEPPSREALHTLFDTTVAPTLDTKCAVCHGPAGTSSHKFLGASLAGHYDTILTYRTTILGSFDKAVAPLITELVPGPHFGLPYTEDEVVKVGFWLDSEKAAISGTPEPTLLEKTLGEWSGCMELATWNTEQVAQRWAGLQSDEGPCIRCHVNGQSTFLATDESERMFNMLTKNMSFLTRYFVGNVADPAAPTVETNLPGIRTVGQGVAPYIEHPRFDAGPNSEAAQALERFHAATVARKAAGLCDPPRLIVEE